MNGLKDLYLPRSAVYQGDHRGIMRNPDCEFEAGPHYHDFYEVQFYFTSAGKIVLNNKSYSLNAGDIVLINMFEPHRFIPKSNVFHQRYSVSLDPSFLLAACSDKSNILSIFTHSNYDSPVHHFGTEVFEKYKSLLLSYEKQIFTYGQDIHERAVLYEILACLYNDLYADSMNNPSAIDTISIVSGLISYIDEHLKEDLSLEELAREAHFSTAYLCRVFKKHTGTTLKQYINQKRIGLAKQLLLENVLPHTACQEIGFNNYSYFYKTFKSITGLSPSEFYEMYHN